MLRALSIRRVVIVDALDLEFGAGLMTLTGETGAGKSILLDSLGLALGARGDAGLVQPGADSASVAATFDLPQGHPARALLHDADIEAEDLLLLRRSLGADGRSRAFVNDRPVSVGLLRAVGETMAEVHGQFQQYGLLDPASHRDLLDEAGGLESARTQTAAAHAAWRVAVDALSEARKRTETVRRDEAFLRHAVEELSALAPEAGEATRLADERAYLMSRGRLAEALQTAMQGLRDADATSALSRGERALARVAEAAEGRFDAALQALERAGIELAEAEHALELAAASLDAGPGDVEAVEGRLYQLRDLARKHDADPDALPSVLERFERDLALIDQSEESLGALEAAADKAEAAYRKAAEALSAGRRKAARALEKAAMQELPPLKLDRAEFEVAVDRLEPEDWSAAGADRVRLMARANPGQAFGPLNKVASGGELARFALALSVVLAARGPARALVFDEVDAGVGGATAAAVGARLRRLSAVMQTLVVTHSPQVAALGDRHFRVEKHEQGGRVTSTVVELSGAARKEEIARMLSGAAVTAEARAQAGRLLEEA